MQQIADWLKKLGMSEYADRFAENRIDLSVLRHLTDQDLKDIGVLLGDRRKMLAAIAQLAGAVPAVLEPTAEIEPKAQDAAERRQLTVMFIDLVGSTALSTKLDPEDLRSVVGTYHKCVAETVARFDGFVAKYMGDGVLAYFGYPQAHEHDAESAVRTGLALSESVPKLATHVGSPLQVRVGIATGLVVVGDLIGAGAAQEQAVVGETPNLAARLQALAEAGAVVIASSTRRLTGGLFEYRDLGTMALKGFAENVPAWQVLRASDIESRFEAMRTATTPLVGRDEEIGLLLRRWEQAKSGDGQVVLISGEPGIGKSRIAKAILDRLNNEPHIRLRYFCSPHHQDSALYPSIAQLERAAGFRREDTAEQRLAKLEAVLAQGTNDLSEVVPLLADLLSIPTGNRYPPLNLTPQKRKEKTLHAQLAQVEGLAAQQPVLMVWEDVHWSDPTTRESLDLLVDRVPTLRVLVILTFRPEFTPPWIGGSHVTMLTLNRLPPRQRAEMIAYVTGGKALPNDIAAQIIDRTDGVPLFIEELTKTVVESGIVTEAGDHYVMAGPMAPLAIPTSLHASLLARLDRLAPTREVAQIGAALGRSFSYELISAVTAMPQQKLGDALSQLVRAELVFQRGSPPDAEYTFKHALVQDAAYGTLLRSRRQELHACIASSLERQFPEVVQAQPELLAQHCAEAGMVEKAIDYWFRAGQRAAQRSANAEAISHFRKAIEALALLPQTVHRDRQELTLQLAIGPAFIATLGWSSAEAEMAYRDALTLSDRLGEQRNRFDALWGLWYVNVTRGPYGPAQQRVHELFSTAASLRDDGLRMQAHHAAWATQFWLGQLISTREHLREGLAIYDPVKHSCHALAYGGHDPGVCGKAVVSANLWLLGYADQAARSAEEAVALAEELGHAPSLTHAIIFTSGMYDAYVRDYTSALKHSEQMIQVASEQKLAAHLAAGMMIHGWALAHHGHFDDGIRELQRGLDAYANMTNVMLPYFTAILADAFLCSGAAELGLSVLGNALRLAQKGEEGFSLTGMLHLRGELLLLSHQEAEAEASFQRALDLAVSQSAKSLELRAATSLARLWAKRDMHVQARNLLAPIYGWFTEGFDTPVVRAGKALLDELA